MRAMFWSGMSSVWQVINIGVIMLIQLVPFEAVFCIIFRLVYHVGIVVNVVILILFI